MERLEILLAGFGGQGVVSMGIILGRAATLAGYSACQTQSYGTESRGGYCRANVVLETGATVGSPVIEDADYFIAFSQAAYDTYISTVKRGLVLYDPALVQQRKSEERAVPVPAWSLAAEKLGKTIAANSIMLGAISRVMAQREGGRFTLDPETMKQSIKDVFPPKIHDINLRGFDIGWEEACKVLDSLVTEP